ncbi:hypothetical protein J551_4101, partial [Acinetobacter sp. 1475718]
MSFNLRVVRSNKVTSNFASRRVKDRLTPEGVC